AALRTRAVRTGEGWRITGQKVWTSAARTADHGILLARTDPDAPKHRGLTYFLVDMKKARGIDIRPLKEITGESLFNEVYFDDVLLPADAVVGEVGGGWRVARDVPLPDHRGRHHPDPAQRRRRAHPRPAPGLNGPSTTRSRKR
ncbi:acyl-CoA dehydrogenase family protein, partial [Streptomyces sp. MBT55]|uniref:acyl-CoA dehydrogenase family protein n=1 Tax=Streptomyces sp. MBT55 TaxID=1488386 RepID=UPI0035ABF716